MARRSRPAPRAHRRGDPRVVPAAALRAPAAHGLAARAGPPIAEALERVDVRTSVVNGPASGSSPGMAAWSRGRDQRALDAGLPCPVQRQSRMPRHLGVLAAALVVGSVAAAQERQFYYPAPPPASFTRLAGPGLRRPADGRLSSATPGGARLPALILFNTPAGAGAPQPFYKAWAEIAASKGLVAILPDLRGDARRAGLRRLLAHLDGQWRGARRRSRSHRRLRRLGQRVPRPAAVRGPATDGAQGGGALLRRRRGDRRSGGDLPILFVRAGLDRPAGHAGDDRAGRRWRRPRTRR